MVGHSPVFDNYGVIKFLLKCCVMTQQEGIMQDIYTFGPVASVWPI